MLNMMHRFHRYLFWRSALARGTAVDAKPLEC